jgi:4-hydroxy-3-methylbut-2-en-1-yl diphosphate reductase
MKSFNIPDFYKSPVISKVKEIRKINDPRKKDFSPTVLDFGPVRFFIARHFGFCYGVEHAIETAYKAIEENTGERIYLLSQMIHNPEVNNDLLKRGVSFLMDTSGNQIIPFSALTKKDVVIIPAFGTTLAIEKELNNMGIEVRKYDTTCPFVERVWKKSEKLGEDQYSIIIHGKFNHEETKATFSRSEKNAPSIIVKDISEAKILGDFILGKVSLDEFKKIFNGKYSESFDPEKDLNRVGVINQTTMLATETQEIAEYFKQVMIQKYGLENLKIHFADTRDTLCYATNENQEATYGLLKQNADLAIVVGGYNSSNTSHIVELCEKKLPTYFISSASEIVSRDSINHYDYLNHELLQTSNYLPQKTPVDIILTSGASCPDSVVDGVLQKILSFYPSVKTIDEVLTELEEKTIPVK